MNKYRPLNLPKEGRFQKNFEDNIAEMTLLRLNYKPFPNEYENPKLYLWMSSIRNRKRDGKLEDENCKRLDRIGFSWNLHLSNWQDNYKSLKRLLYKGIYPQGKEIYNNQLAWIGTQLDYYHQGELLPNECEQWEDLDECTFLATNIYPIEERKGLSGDERQRRWDSNFDELVYSINNPPYKWPKPSKSNYKKMTLYRWVRKQFEDFDNGFMHEGNVAKWNNLNHATSFDEVFFEDVWMARFERVREIYLKHDRGLYKKDKVYKWCSIQYNTFESLSIERRELLNSIRFRAYFIETDWDVRYRWLTDYTKIHNKYPTGTTNQLLSTWLHFQRMKCKTNKFSASKKKKIRLLDKKYAEKYTDDEIWYLQFNDLVSFIEENKYWPRVKIAESREHKLYNWCQSQRKKHSKSNYPFLPLKQDKVDLLDGIGIKWTDDDASEKRWMYYCGRLEKYIKRTGNNILPEIVDGKRFSLHRWLAAQKKAFGNKSLATNKKEILTTLGVL